MATNGAQERDAIEEALSLRVGEGLGRDVGRGLARIDPRDMARLGVQVGDIVGIAGERSTVAKVMPTYTESRGKGLVQIDGITRANAGAGLDQRVKVVRTSHAPAARVALRLVADAKSTRRGVDPHQVGRLIEGLPLIVGDRVRVTLFGARYQDFEVIAVSPKGASVVVHPQTQIILEASEGAQGKATKEGPSRVAYEDIGGLHKEVRRVREMIELPLRYPELFERLGIDPPKGVLLHGPPGTGKTLLARAVAHETEAHFIAVSGPEIIHKFYGESEAKLRGIFEQARKHAPCILFLDEIDAIAPKRENVQGEVEKRVVAQLLALLDGLEARGQIIVIAATNLPNLLDPALRRPGRFDRELEIGVPDTSARGEILEIHTRGMPLAEDVKLPQVAAMTHGYVGADLEALAREAAMTALREAMPRIDLTQRELSGDLLHSLTVTMAHFRAAFSEIEPSAIREVCVEVPNVPWSDVGGLDDVKREIREAIELPLKYPELLRRAKVRPPKGILLCGPPGTGKTLLAKAAASQTGVNFISIKGPSLMSKYIGESEKAMREIFKKARQAAPCILFFDEIDSLAPARGGEGDSQASARVLSQLLTEMDGIEELKGVLVMAATNRKDMIDPALLRPGRFDLVLDVKRPDREAREAIFAICLKDVPVKAGVDTAELSRQTDDLAGADIDLVCRRAGLAAVQRAIEALERGAAAPDLEVTQADLLDAIEESRRSARPSVVRS
jgi:transitional endoplasmic reticulum ATPase